MKLVNFLNESYIKESTDFRKGDRVKHAETGEQGTVLHKGNRDEVVVKFGSLNKSFPASQLRLVDELKGSITADTQYGRAHDIAMQLSDKAKKSRKIDHYVDAIKAHKEALKHAQSATNQAAHRGHIKDLSSKLIMAEEVELDEAKGTGVKKFVRGMRVAKTSNPNMKGTVIKGGDNLKNAVEVEWDSGTTTMASGKYLMSIKKNESVELDEEVELDENRLLKVSKISSAEYQKAKKLKGFDASKYKWNPDTQLYHKVQKEEVDLDEIGMGMIGALSKKSRKKAIKGITPKRKKNDKQLYMQSFVSNFYGGRYYERGIDSMFVLASSPEEASEIAEKHIDAALEHFKNKRYSKGSKTIPALKKDERYIKVGGGAKPTTQQKHPKVLTADGVVKPVDLAELPTNEAHGNSKVYDKCWDGYKKVPGKKRGEKGSCVKESDNNGFESIPKELQQVFRGMMSINWNKPEHARYDAGDYQSTYTIKGSAGIKNTMLNLKDMKGVRVTGKDSFRAGNINVSVREAGQWGIEFVWSNPQESELSEGPLVLQRSTDLLRMLDTLLDSWKKEQHNDKEIEALLKALGYSMEKNGDRVQLVKESVCPACSGKGHKPAAGGMDRTCDVCDGTGKQKIEEAPGAIRKGMAAVALIAGLWGVNNQLAQQAYDASPQLQKLTAYLEVAKQHNDQRMIDQLEQRIENHKARLDLGKGEVMGKDGRPVDVVYDKNP